MNYRLPLLYLISFLFHSAGFTQGITGTWEGRMSDEILQVNIVQEKDKLCGYTYDVVLNDKSSYCKAYFMGRYDKVTGIYTIRGISFIENSGSHVLMTLRFWQPDKNNKSLLRGIVSTGSMFEDYLGFSNDNKFIIRRVSKKPTPVPGKKSVCYTPPSLAPNASIKKSPEKPVTAPITKTNPPVKPKSSKPVATQPAPPKVAAPAKQNPKLTPPTEDTLKKTAGNKTLLAPLPSDPQVIKQLNGRKNTSLSSLVVDAKKIQLKVYDNGIVDNDTVSIFYNGRLVKSKQQLSEKALIINLELDEGVENHQITLFAENLGSIPPNTAIIVVTAGTKRYELHSSASLVENAVLNIRYEPPAKQ
jgi:hypothetical protein